MKPGVAISILLVLAVFVYAFAVNWRQYAQPAPAPAQSVIQYTSDAAKLSFSYPPHLQIDSHIEGNSERNWPVITLMDKTAAANIPRNSEAPPAIIIAAYPNPENLDLEQWVHSDARSNWKLTVDDRAATTTSIAALPALRYHYSGLYENDAVAVASGGTVYVFTVQWLSPEDTLRQEFDALIKTVTFL